VAAPKNPRSSELRLAGFEASLRCAQLFSGLPPEDVRRIAALAEPIALAKGGYLFREGEPSRGFFLARTGAINVHRVSAGGREQVIHVFRAGETFAEAALASPTGYPADARAEEPSGVLLFPKGPMLELIAGRPDLALRMLGSMSAHLRVIVGMLDDLTLKDAETRVLNWIVQRCPPAGAVEVRLGSTKRVLAAELATSSETLSRTFARLRDAGLIEVRGATVRVRDAAALRTRFRRLLGDA
jgi:CRP/FNR family transcriptional regulator